MNDSSAGKPKARLVAIGADGAPSGWVAACLYADAKRPTTASVWQTRVRLCANVAELAELREQGGGEATVAIDVPIGLPDTAGYRACDLKAREILKQVGRASSVFAPPARYMLEAAGDYSAIRALVEEERKRNPAAHGISSQSAALAPKIKQVDVWVRTRPGCHEWLVECHPELSWYALSGGERLLDKRSGSGLVRRLQLLRELFPDAEERIAAAPWPGKQAALSDLLDAYAALSSALAFARSPDEYEELGEGEPDSEGLPMRMVM
jgi:predicted RNase H-like nuclease